MLITPFSFYLIFNYCFPICHNDLMLFGKFAISKDVELQIGHIDLGKAVKEGKENGSMSKEFKKMCALIALMLLCFCTKRKTKQCPSVSPRGQHVANCLSHRPSQWIRIGNAHHLGITGKGMLNYRWLSPPLDQIPLTASKNPMVLHCLLKFRALMGWPYLPILIQNLDS